LLWRPATAGAAVPVPDPTPVRGRAGGVLVPGAAPDEEGVSLPTRFHGRRGWVGAVRPL